MKQINLGVVISSDGSQWTGGVEYYLNLFKAIRKVDISGRIKITGLIAPGLNQAQIQFLETYLNEAHIIPKSNFLQKAYEHVDYKKYFAPLIPFVKSPVEKISSHLKLDIVFVPPYMVEYIQRPCVTWIPDFQHVFIPEIFSQNEIANRDYVFRVACNKADAVILSSETALGDFASLFPEKINKVYVLKFVSQAPEMIFNINPENIVRKYSLPERFYYLPNQFWKHKNHRTVLDALEICVKKIPEMCVVCTGNLYENRDPTFPSKLLSDISQKGLRNNFVVLGLIDRADVYSLTRHCIAIIQPSFFEGWSTTVEEAKSLGKPVILSNIPVHIEQNPEPGFYFEPHNSRQLSNIMIEQWDRLVQGVNVDTENKAILDTEGRMVEYGNKFINCLDRLLG